MKILGIEHVSINVADLAASVDFYEHTLGFRRLEALIGDVQGDLLEPESSVMLDMRSAEPASPACMLALAYTIVGEHPRAVDLMQRVVELGARLGNRALEAQGQGVLAFIAMSADDPCGAARWAEVAMPWYEAHAATTRAAAPG